MINVGYGVTLLSRCLRDGGIDGIGSYTKELLDALQSSTDINITSVSFGEAIPQEVKKQSINNIRLSKFAGQAFLSATTGISFFDSAKLKSTTKIDLFHATDHRIPKLGGIPVVATLMDAIPLSNPEWINMKFAKQKFALWKKSSQWADHILTISEYSKKQIVEHFKINESNISVIPLGVDKRWFQKLDLNVLQAVRLKYNLPKTFLLSVGTLQPRKNIERVIDAHQQLPGNIYNQVPLVIVGRQGWMCDELVNKLESDYFGDSVIWLRHLPDKDLLAVVQLASVLVFASLAEGFGLPVLEAFAAGTPVITSNTTSLPEVAGEAALLINPYDTEEITDAMLRVLGDSELINILKQKGHLRAECFTWDRTAAATAQSYKTIINK